MNVDEYFFLLQVTHAVPLVIAALRYKKLDSSYHPFILLLVLGFINETVNYLSIKFFNTSSVSFNTFHIIDFLLMLYIFKRWGFFKSNLFYNSLVIIAVVAWMVENFIVSRITVPNPYFRIFYAFAVELIIVSRLIYVLNERTSLVKNARFLICLGFIIVYMYQIVFEGALLTHSMVGKASPLVIRAMGYTDILVQLLYSWALVVADEHFVFPTEKKIRAVD